MNIIQIDRSKPFDPRSFLGNDWMISDQDQRALNLRQIDVSSVVLKTVVENNRGAITENERENYFNKFIKQKYISLDIAVAKSFWEEQAVILSEWNKDKEEMKMIHFPGTLLKRVSINAYFFITMFWNNGKYDLGFARVEDTSSNSNSWFPSDLFALYPL